MKRLVAALVLGALGCATGYHSTGLTGGFEETRLSDDVYQVRFQGNAYTPSGKVSKFILRRCAELTLERGARYFAMASSDRQTASSGGAGMMFSFPNGTATIKVLQDKGADPLPLDAVTIIQETDKEAGGQLSPKARKTLIELK